MGATLYRVLAVMLLGPFDLKAPEGRAELVRRKPQVHPSPLVVVLKAKGAHGKRRGVEGLEVGDEESGPSVSVSTSTGDGWSLDMTLDRNMESSQDPGIPGRPGDVILGGGFEIVYVRTDTLDLDSTLCLTIIEQITWFPRQPTSYFVNVFTVEDKIIPELQDLKETLGASDAVDIELACQGFSDPAIKEIWIHRLSTAIEDWENTLTWASPDFNPASATDEALKATAYDDAETELQSSPYMPLTSTEIRTSLITI